MTAVAICTPKGEAPITKIRRTRGRQRRTKRARSRTFDIPSRKWAESRTADTACDATVAQAAPAIPKGKTMTHSQSSTILVPKAAIMINIALRGKPSFRTAPSIAIVTTCAGEDIISIHA